MDSYVGMYVDETRGKKPLPVLTLTWKAPGMGNALGPIWFEQLRYYLKMERTRRSRWHKWEPPVWRTNKIWASFAYRDSEHDETLRCNIMAPAWADVVKQWSPQARQELEGRTQVPPIIQDAQIPEALQNWFGWKAAYQEAGYYVLVYGDLLDLTARTWRPRWDDVPVFLCEDIDFSELGEFERILLATQDARESIRNRKADQ